MPDSKDLDRATNPSAVVIKGVKMTAEEAAEVKRKFEAGEYGGTPIVLPESAVRAEPVVRIPDHLQELVNAITYWPRWEFRIVNEYDPDGSGGLQLRITSYTQNSFNFKQMIRVVHSFLIPNTSWNRDTWAAWLFDRVIDVHRHEAGEAFRINGVREFAPHHGNGEDPYRVWHVSDRATADKSSGDD